jgi:sarcosine oxidase
MAAGESNLQTRGVEYEKLNANEVNSRFPAFHLAETDEGLMIPAGRLCLAQNCLEAFSTASTAKGAVLIEDSVVLIDRVNKCVTTESGKELHYSKLVIASGAWTNKLLGLASPPLAKLPVFVSNEQTVNFGFQANGKCYDWDNTPISSYRFINKEGRLVWFYIAPHVSGGIEGWKIGMHQQGPIMSTEDYQLDRPAAEVPEMECSIRNHMEYEQRGDLDCVPLAITQEFIRDHLPALDPDNIVLYMRCLYQNVEDGRFIIGKHPEDPDVAVCCGFSGEGFKHAPIIGSFVANLVSPAALPDANAGLFARMAPLFDPARFF